MSLKQRYLCAFYGLTALIALAVTWAQLAPYYQQAHDLKDLAAGFGRYMTEMRVTPAARAISGDLLIFGLAMAVFMVLEARRLGIRFVWLYIALGFVVAASFAFPLFMIARERHLAWHESAAPDDGPARVPLADGLGLALVSAVALGLGGLVLMGA